jgi:O-antigen ligase
MAHRSEPTAQRKARPSRGQVARWLERSSAWALGALLATLPFWRHRVLLHRPLDPVFFEFRDITLYTNDLFWWGAVAAWLLSRIVQRGRSRLRAGPWFVFGPLIGFLALSLAGMPLAVDPPYAAYQAARFVPLLALYLMLVNVRLTPGTIAWPLAMGMVVQAVVAMPQFALGRTLGLQRLGEVMANATWSGSSVVKVGQESFLRAYGFAQHPNLLAGCLMAMLLIVSGYYLAQEGWKRLLLLAALGAGCVALLLTFSRAAWLGTLLGGVVALALLRRETQVRTLSFTPSTFRLLGVVVVAVSVSFVALNGPLVQSRFDLATQPTEVQSVEMRRMQVPAAVALIRMRPLLGVGLGNYATALYTLAPDQVTPDRICQPVFAVPLLVTAELGILGGVLWLVLIAAPWPALWRRCSQTPVTPWWAGLSAALLALAVVSFFDFYLWTSHQGPLVLWIVLGLWGREWEETLAAHPAESVPRPLGQ